MTAKEKRKLAREWLRADSEGRRLIEWGAKVSRTTLYAWSQGRQLGPRGRPRGR